MLTFIVEDTTEWRESLIGDSVNIGYNIMSRKERYIREDTRKPIKKEYCTKGWHCPNLPNHKCNLHHDQDDIKIAQKLASLRKYPQTIIILDTYDPKLPPFCLLYPSLIIDVVNQKQFKMEVGKYYSAKLLEQQRPNQIAFKVEKETGSFGKWKVEEQIFYQYFPLEYELENQKETKFGEVKINGEFVKMVRGEGGKKYRFQKVNEPCRYPLLVDSKVNYYQKGNSIQVTRIIYPNQIKLCGILQIDKNSQLYFVSRNQQYDDMNPYLIPQDLIEKLAQFKGLIPYSLLRTEPLSQVKQTKINDILKEYLVKGRFRAWPHQSRYPIIELLDQISIKNFKSLKDGIIYQTGISMTPFDKKEKDQSLKIAKKFKIQDYSDNRKTYDKSVFTVDGRETKCHDDAVFIEQAQTGEFYVEIHIADVAALIEQGSEIDRKLKKRDETIYIKNYYQPMLYDCLKNMLSLKEQQDKLVFTLSFEITPQGFIDYRSVQFQKNIVNVEKNLSHQRIESGVQKYPELKKLNKKMEESGLIDNSYILQSETSTEAAINRLIVISSVIPTFLMQTNIQRAKTIKEEFEHYLKDMIQKRKQDMQKWEENVDNIQKLSQNENKNIRQLRAIQRNIDKQVNRQKQNIMKKLKQENRSRKQKREKRGMKGGEDNQSIQSELQNQDEINQIQDELDEAGKEEQLQVEEDQREEVKHQKQLNEKLKRAKALKQVNVKDIQSSEESSQEKEQESSEDDELQNEKYRFNAAVNGQKFLQKIFKNPLFNIDMQWRDMEQIKDAFKLILSKDKGKLYQEYFKRLQIMNRQHFKYILKLEKDKRKNIKKQANQTQTGSKNIYNKREKEQKQPRTRGGKKYQLLKPESQKIKQEQQNKELKKQNNKYNSKQMDKKEEKKQSTENQTKQQLQHGQKSDTPSQERVRQKNQRKQPKQPKKPRQPRQPKQQRRQRKPKQIKQQGSKQVRLGLKQQKIFRQEPKQRQKQEIEVDKQARVEKQSQQIMFKEARNTNQRTEKLVASIKLHMEAQQEKYAQRYMQAFIKDRRLVDLDISFNQQDEKIMGKYQMKVYKKQKINRLKVILRRHIKKQNKQQKAIPAKKKQGLQKNQQKQIQKNPLENQIYQKLKVKIEEKQQYYLNKYEGPFNNNQKLEISDDDEQEIQGQEVKQVYKKLKKGIILRLITKKLKFEKKSSKRNNKPQNFKKVKQQSKFVQNEKLNIKIQEFPFINNKEQNNIKSEQKVLEKNIEGKQKVQIKVQLQQFQQSAIGQRVLQRHNKIEKGKVQIKPQKLSKKALKKKIQLQVQPFLQLIEEKYKKQKQELKLKAAQIKQKMKKQKDALSHHLESVNEEFNLLKLLSGEEATNRKNKKANKKKEKQPKKDDKEKKSEKDSILAQFLQNFKFYAAKVNFKFKQMKISQLDSYLSKILRIGEICQDNPDAIEMLNRQSSKKCSKQQQLLKWNNPIRSYSALTVMRLIKNFKWLFEGKLYPTDVIQYHGDIKQVEKKLKELSIYRSKKIEEGELNKKAKEANREISKLQFYNLVKKDQNAVFSFLNIGSPCPQKVKFVFHPILEEVEVDNIKFRQQMYKEVRGRVKIIREFPLKLRIILE